MDVLVEMTQRFSNSDLFHLGALPAAGWVRFRFQTKKKRVCVFVDVLVCALLKKIRETFLKTWRDVKTPNGKFRSVTFSRE